MSGSHFDTATALCLVGFVFLVMPLMAWAVLRGRYPATRLHAWCAGACGYGAACLLLALRGVIPSFWSVHVANCLALLSFPFSVAALRQEMGAPPRWHGAALFVAASAAALAVAAGGAPGGRALVADLLQLAGTAWVAWAAARLWRRSRLRSARLIAWAYGAVALALAWLGLQLALSGWQGSVADLTGATQLVVVAGILAGIYGSLGYLGMALEISRTHEIAQAQRLAQESALRGEAVQHARRLRAWLDERDELLRLLAHEVRQPLHNASAALQSAHRVLAPAQADAVAAALRLQRAQGVLGQIVGALDNVLAATALLASGRVDLRDVDVETLIALAIGDLDPAMRARVRIERNAAARTAGLDAGLVRLALRNLLGNALTYSPPDTEVLLRLSDSDEPLGLVFEVCDRGQGIEPALAPRLFTRGARGDHSGAGHGLGLYVVRRVAERHGGSFDFEPRAGGGALFRLWLPQGLADEPAPAPGAAPARPSAAPLTRP